MNSSDLQRVDELIAAGQALAAAGLVTAFGHVSVRTAQTRLMITPPAPLGSLDAAMHFAQLDVDRDSLPDGAPREAWIHLAIARARSDVGAICRAQPQTATALASARVPIRALHGQGAYLGPEVPVFEEADLVRDLPRAERLAAGLGAGSAIVMRGNGAVTTGANVGEAVARMWVLEVSAQLNSVAAAAGTPTPLSAEEQASWVATAPEILGRLWTFLRD
jgi:HCOMODA/2-hydroxy-3-carboxy-muconic semialdehyde decarboxylase